jgi:hypothetical protein
MAVSRVKDAYNAGLGAALGAEAHGSQQRANCGSLCIG